MNRAIHVVSSMATRALLADLIEAWQSRGGTPVAVESVGGVDAVRRVAAGEPFDVVVLHSDAIDRLVDSGHAAAGSKTDFVRSEVAIAVRQGADPPTIADEKALRAAVLGASRIAFSTGPSGTALQRLFQQWDLMPLLQDRLVQAPPGVPVGDLVARGEADIGFQQLSELMNVPGIDVLPMPPGLEIITTFSAALCSAARDAVCAQALLDALRPLATGEATRRHGMTPIPSSFEAAPAETTRRQP